MLSKFVLPCCLRIPNLSSRSVAHKLAHFQVRLRSNLIHHSGKTSLGISKFNTLHNSFGRRLFSNSSLHKMPFAKIDSKELHYTDSQTASGHSPLTLIFVHGLGSTQNYYQPILPYLSAYRCITFDNYGAGRSRYYSELLPETSVESIGQDVIGLMDYLKVDEAVVVGYSMGGMLPTYLASHKKFGSRIIAGICIGPVNPNPAAAEIFRKRVITVREGGMETMANTIPTAATGPSTTPLQKAFIREMIMSQDPEGYIANCRAIENATPPDYANVTCPILIIAGQVDKSAPLEGCKFIYDNLGTKNAKIEILEGIGHWHCVEDSEKVGGLIKDFVGTL